MSSYTIHCIGYTHIDSNQRRRMRYAMNRLEVHQQTRLAELAGDPLEYWIAQTGTGHRILGTSPSYPDIDADKIPATPGLITCPACYGIRSKRTGTTSTGLPIIVGCFVCDTSGIATTRHMKPWQPWQIQRLRQELGIASQPTQEQQP